MCAHQASSGTIFELREDVLRHVLKDNEVFSEVSRVILKHTDRTARCRKTYSSEPHQQRKQEGLLERHCEIGCWPMCWTSLLNLGQAELCGVLANGAGSAEEAAVAMVGSQRRRTLWTTRHSSRRLVARRQVYSETRWYGLRRGMRCPSTERSRARRRRVGRTA